jgi:probable rRNA maturation factor
MSLVFVGRQIARRLHREWFGLDSVTDVVSFPSGTPLPGALPEDGPIGEVIVCVPVCEESALARGLPLHDEVARMLIHGALHLLGYDHATAAQKRRMLPRQRRHVAWYRRSGLEVMEPI